MGVVMTTLNPSPRLGNSPSDNGAHFLINYVNARINIDFKKVSSSRHG